MDVAVKDFVKQGKALLLRHAQTDLDERSALDLFLIVSGLAQRTVPTVEVGVGHVVNDAGWSEPIPVADTFKQTPLPSLRVQGL